ncbi:hypothetical protein LO763_10390 [Glycomyces sp. A-F 0318]|uniref:hypothetical protein n=1 Tax=Glycomyces amatae TaxID=2881355 RepID=UPI001E5FEB17|nr:hypothetical protein [Glycomyces amatae]MCD0444031.1 hypothetical protein [Glycomyces amatae]
MATVGFAERLHGRTAAGVPRWAVRTAYATALTALPSALWRIAALIAGLPLMEVDPEAMARATAMEQGPWWYIVALSVVSEALAFLAVGLVAVWGEVWPRWVPVLRGRRVPVAAAVAPAAVGAAALMVLPYAMVMYAFGLGIDGEPTELVVNGWQNVVFWIAYAPLALWGPLLAVLTVHYYRRRSARLGPMSFSQGVGAPGWVGGLPVARGERSGRRRRSGVWRAGVGWRARSRGWPGRAPLWSLGVDAVAGQEHRWKHEGSLPVWVLPGWGYRGDDWWYVQGYGISASERDVFT